MKKELRIFSIVLLLFLGLSAIGGGWMLISDPSGVSMELPIELLNLTPFDNYLVPGVILLFAIEFYYALYHLTMYTVSLILMGAGIKLSV